MCDVWDDFIDTNIELLTLVRDRIIKISKGGQFDPELHNALKNFLIDLKKEEPWDDPDIEKMHQNIIEALEYLLGLNADLSVEDSTLIKMYLRPFN